MQAASELLQWYKKLLFTIDAHLIRYSATVDSRVFYLKMKGDYYRHCTEVSLRVFPALRHLPTSCPSFRTSVLQKGA